MSQTVQERELPSDGSVRVRRPDDEARPRAFDVPGVLERGPEERIDRITRFAQQVFGSDGASINLLDDDFFVSKSNVNLPYPRLHREVSFCAHTIQHPESLLIEDATLDPRFRDNPLVVGGEVRFYAGHPLVAASGERIGALCVFGTDKRTVTDEEQALLQDLAHWAQDELNRTADRTTGAATAPALLPMPLTALEGYDLAGVSQPMNAVGGDFYDWYPVRGGAAITLGDVMGKGVAAALVAASARATLRASRRNSGPAATVTTAAGALHTDLETAGVFLTLFHGHLDQASGLLRFVDAGHGLSLVVRADGSSERLWSLDLPLGVGDVDCDERTIALAPGDALVSVSDGVLDALGGTLDALDLVAAAVTRASDAAAAAQDVALSARATADDDMTVLVVRRSL